MCVCTFSINLNIIQQQLSVESKQGNPPRQQRRISRNDSGDIANVPPKRSAIRNIDESMHKTFENKLSYYIQKLT